MKTLTKSLLLLTPIGLAAVTVARKVASVSASIDAHPHPDLDARMKRLDDVEHRTMQTSDGGTIHYIVTGPADAPTVVFCHGVSGQWWVWSAVIRDLRSDCRVLAWDMRGHGQSVAGSDGVTIEAAARDLAELLTALDVDDVVVCGHSMGGMELGRFLVDHTATAIAHVSGACFLATSAKSATGSLLKGGLARNSKWLNRFATLAGDRTVHLDHDNTLAAVAMRVGFGPNVTRTMINDQMDLQNEFSPKSNREASGSIARHDVFGRLRSAAIALRPIRTIVLSGAHDHLTPPIHGRGIGEALPHAEYRELRDSGHNIMVEDPDAVVQAVRELMKPG